MGIYNWDNGKRVDTRKTAKGVYEALIYPSADASVNPNETQSLFSTLQSQGYTLSPQVEQSVEHSLVLSGLHNTRDIRTLEKLAKKNGLSLNKEENGSITLSGLAHGMMAEHVMRALQRKPFMRKKDVTLSHEITENPPQQRLHISGISDESAFLELIENNGWAQGKRSDEYDGMSVPKKAWTKMVESSKKFVSAFFMLGDAQIIASTAIDAKRIGTPFWKHDEMAEGVGMAFGSSSILMGELLAESPSVDSVLTDFKANFKSGDGYDFSGKSEHFDPGGRSWGRALESIKNEVRDNSVDNLMMVDLWSSTGMWRGRFSDIIATEEIGGIRNVKLNQETGEVEHDKRLKKNNRNSAVLYSTAAAITSFVPQNPKYMSAQDTEAPFVNYTTFGDKIRSIPVVGQIWSGIGGLSDTTIGNVLLYPARKVMSWLEKDPRNVGGKVFLSHNLNQVYYGVLNMRARQQDIEAFSTQFSRESELLEAGKLTAPARPEGHLEVNLHEVQDNLRIIYNLDDAKGFQSYIDTYNSRLEHNEKPTDKETFLATKAMNRQYLLELNEELRRDKSKFGGYATFLAGNLMLSYSGKGHVKEFNGLEQKVNPFAVAAKVAEFMRAEGAADEQSIRNAAGHLYQNRGMAANGLGVDDLAEILTAKMNGKVSKLESRQWEEGLWPVASQPQENRNTEIQTHPSSLAVVADSTRISPSADGLSSLSQQMQTDAGIQGV